MFLPEPVLAWLFVVLGLGGIVFGTVCAMKVRRSMNAEAGWMALLRREGSTLGLLLHEYDEGDKALMVAGLVLRPVLGALLAWGVVGLVWR